MNKKRTSLKMLKEFAKEEKTTSKLYNSLGYKKQAKQEQEHAKFFEKIIKKRK